MGFDPNAPPPKTEWFWSIVDAGRAPEESELATVLDFMADPPGSGEKGWPGAVTVSQLVAAERRRSHARALDEIASGVDTRLEDRKNRKAIPHRMEAVGYVRVRNTDAKDGLWKVDTARMVIYAKRDLEGKDQMTAVKQLLAEVGESQ